jgi:acyl-coenzyme A synthetase/AMP-(fatty) acid ligase
LPSRRQLIRCIQEGRGRGRVIATRDGVLPLDKLEHATSLGSDLKELHGRSVILSIQDVAKAAAALLELDGLARRVVICPPDWETWRLQSAAMTAEADALVYDGDAAKPMIHVRHSAACRLPLQALNSPRVVNLETEWVLPTSGTTGSPKLVAHTLSTLTGAIADAPMQQWATFYDIRRYGGLQIFLRALLGSGSLIVGAAGEDIGRTLTRFGTAGITHISGTPTHWRKVLMSGEGQRIDPAYIRLSGEIADEPILSALRALYPRARIEHAYASTEAGVVFAVDDGRPGFPARWLGQGGDVQMKVVDSTLRVRSNRCARRYLGEGAPSLTDNERFVDTGDIVETRGDRCYFMGRRGGVINVGGVKIHPEEVEAALNSIELVSASRVFARKSPITGALVCAEIVLREGCAADRDTELRILSACRGRLGPRSAPVAVRFVADLPMTPAGKVARYG